MMTSISLLLLVNIATCFADLLNTRDVSNKTTGGSFTFHNQQTSFAYNDTGGSYTIEESSGNYKYKKLEGEFLLDGTTSSGPDVKNRLNGIPSFNPNSNVHPSSQIGLNTNTAHAHAHPHVPHSLRGIQHFHFPNGPHPFHDVVRGMSNSHMNRLQQVQMPHHQMNIYGQIIHPYMNQFQQIPNPQSNQFQQISHPQINGIQQMPHSNQFQQMQIPHPQMNQQTPPTQLESSNQQEQVWITDSDSLEENPGSEETLPGGRSLSGIPADEGIVSKRRSKWARPTSSRRL